MKANKDVASPLKELGLRISKFLVSKNEHRLSLLPAVWMRVVISLVILVKIPFISVLEMRLSILCFKIPKLQLFLLKATDQVA